MLNETNIRSGLFYSFLANFFVAVMAMSMKWLGEAQYPLLQIMFMRSVIGLIVSSACMWVLYKTFWTRTFRLHLHFARFGLMSLAFPTSVVAISLLPLADSTTIAYSFSFCVFLISALTLGEKVGKQRLLAVLVGFSGVAIVMQPGSTAFSIGGVIMLISIMFMASNQVLSKYMIHFDDPLTIGHIFLVISSVFYALFMPFCWVMPNLIDLLMFIILGVSSFLVVILMNIALTKAPAVVVSPLEYTNFLWILIFGYFIWSEIPSRYVWYGAPIIITAGLFFIYREYKTAKSS